MTVAAEKASWGGRRHGKSVAEHLKDGTYRPDRHDPSWAPNEKPLELEDPAVYVAERIGLSPRMAARRPDLVGRFEVVSPGEHLDRFARFFCRHTREVPSGPPLGSPFGLEVFQREFFDEALEVDGDGNRVYSFAGMVIPRKNGKTTASSLIALYMASPADGEHRPEVILGAGTLKQAGKLWDNATAFITDKLYGSQELRRLFLAQANAIHCPSVSGKIERVAGDGDSNHSLDPHVVVADELHTWKTPKQQENWKALTTAQGGRNDPIVLFLSTEGDGNDNELAALLERVVSSNQEREVRSKYLTIYRDRAAGDLVYVYAIPSAATLADVEEFEAANPAPWRTAGRIAKDLLTPRVDTPTKLRLYGNRRATHKDRWITDEMWEAVSGDATVAGKAIVSAGVDAARTRDTTALAWGWKRDDGVIVLNCRVWAAREDAACHVSVPGGRLDNDDVRDYLRDVVMADHAAQLLFYDERYFDTQANDLSKAGMTVVEMYQGKSEMWAAWDEFYDAVYHQTIEVPRDPVLLEHVRSAVGTKTERGWKVSKIKSDRRIDGLAAMVMAHYGAKHFSEYRKRKKLYSWQGP